MINGKMIGMLLAAFVAGSFVASPELRAYAANTIGSADIIDGQVKNADLAPNAVTTSKINDGAVKTADIGDGEVKIADIAAGAVGTVEIADGTITYPDLSRSFVTIDRRFDCDCGGTGWDPDGTSLYERIYDSRITLASVVSVTTTNTNGSTVCGVVAVYNGGADVKCTTNIPQFAVINYAIFTPG